MSAKSATQFKVSFTLDEQDAAYFRRIFRNAKKHAAGGKPEDILQAARDLVLSVRKTKKAPRFVLEAVESIEDLAQLIEDEDYRAPKSTVKQILGALAYFSDPQDLIPDDVPVIGFLDDAIMIRIVEEEFKHELWGYRRFRKFRDGAEQRPWTNVASARLPSRLEAQRKKLRLDIDRRNKNDAAKGNRWLGL